MRICSNRKTREGTYVSSYVSVRYLKTVRICACGDHSTWTRPQRDAGGGGHLRIARFFICKSVSPDKSGTDVMSSVCLIKVSNDAREWTHHDHTASELPDNTRNV